MTNKHFYRAIIFRVICIVGLTITMSYLMFVRHQIIWSVVIMLMVIGFTINTIVYLNNVNQWIASFLLGIENEDTTLRIPTKNR